jgi:glucosyl-3-phosphoglycerate synthase
VGDGVGDDRTNRGRERVGPVLARSAFDAASLARRKEEVGLTTSVVIPARDEGPRVGAVIAAVRRAMRPVPGTRTALVDELVVVDGRSRDDTVEQATLAGARVVQQTAGTGKGAALQLGVASTSGDLVAFVDADVRDPDPWLAIGPLAPLIMDDGLRLVKSAAQRSWEGGSGPGGGRVTELTVRPLLALLWPGLAHVAQPLAGEYAADRALLEALPFERGYGVELGLLIDTARTCGAGAIGQIDLGVRGHEHQSLDALGRMAAELVLVVADRLALEGRGLGVDATSLALPRSVRGPDGAVGAEQLTVGRSLLPPLVRGGPHPRRRGPSPSP